jgi:hypothetical protein
MKVKEEIPKNEGVIYDQQIIKIKTRQHNATRRQIRPGWVITWYLFALVAVAAWAYRLLGYYSLPF